jgi:hypothetical protein
MLEPDRRIVLLDALRPPPGYRLDMAVGTTYSLDLLALMTAPVAFSLFDRANDDGSLREDPIATLQALRQHAARISLFCQAGQIAVPPAFRPLLVYLEDSVYPVVPPRAEKIFHPKVWYLRFRGQAPDDVRLRLLCASRNLTFDRSWDTILRLEGGIGKERLWPELGRFAASLLAMAEKTRPLPRERADAIRELGDQFASANWELPDDFEEVRFWPLGDDGAIRWPFAGRRDRTLVISPFVTADVLHQLTQTPSHDDSILVSRAESLDALGGTAVGHLAECLVLAADAAVLDDAAVGSDPREALAEAADRRLEGLHAKTYVADAGWKARVWTGSANATDAAFNGNVEFLVELCGRKDRCGVHTTIGDHNDRLGLRRLVEPYAPPQEAPLEPSEEELIERRLDEARRSIGALRLTVACEPIPDDRWRLTLQGTPVQALDEAMLAGIEARIRPVTLGAGPDTPLPIAASGFTVEFLVSEPAITPYFALSLALGNVKVAFLIVGELSGAPPDRADRVLANIVSNRAEFLRFLLLLLGDTEDALSLDDTGSWQPSPTEAWLAAFSAESLLEPLVRAYSRDPERLHDVARVLGELRRHPERAAVLPERWDDIWEPIAAALAARETP